MEWILSIINAFFLLGVPGITWWYAKATSRLLKQAQGQVSTIESQAIAKIKELQDTYARILREVDERRQAEARLKESEARFAAFMRHVPGTAVILDDKGECIFANETWERVFGHVSGNPEAGEAARAFGDLNHLVMTRGQPLEHLERLEQDGKIHFWLVTRFPIPHPDGQTLMVGAIGLDITTRLEVEEALRQSEQKLRSLAAQLLSAQEDERKRLAAELHDELGHTLLTLKLKMEALGEELLPQQAPMKDELQHILQVIGGTIAEVRRLYLDLSPGDLEDLGLTGALHSLVEEFMALTQDLSWTVEMDDIDGLFPLSVQTAIYRVIQEALTNIGKHAEARKVTLAVRREPQGVSFLIADDGRGFDKQEVLADQKTLGLLAMEERVRILGGSFELASRKGQGTRIVFSIPAGGSVR
jgi:signal transduction histidine kinase